MKRSPTRSLRTVLRGYPLHMLTILLVIIVVLLLTGGWGYSRRGRRI
jgi:hypothetical protein